MNEKWTLTSDKNSNKPAKKTIGTSELMHVTGGRLKPSTANPKVPVKTPPAVPKEPIFITDALHENGGNWHQF